MVGEGTAWDIYKPCYQSGGNGNGILPLFLPSSFLFLSLAPFKNKRDLSNSLERTGRDVASGVRSWSLPTRKWGRACTSLSPRWTSPALPKRSAPFPWSICGPCGRNPPRRSPEEQRWRSWTSSRTSEGGGEREWGGAAKSAMGRIGGGECWLPPLPLCFRSNVGSVYDSYNPQEHLWFYPTHWFYTMMISARWPYPCFDHVQVWLVQGIAPGAALEEWFWNGLEYCGLLDHAYRDSITPIMKYYFSAAASLFLGTTQDSGFDLESFNGLQPGGHLKGCLENEGLLYEAKS